MLLKSLLLLSLVTFSLNTNAQNLFPVKLENCPTDRFCLDCGDIPASYDKFYFNELEEKLNKSLKLNGIKGAVKFQVLIDSNGRGCVLSHTDELNHPVTQKIITQLNKFNKWTPAITANKKEARTSVILVFTIREQSVFSRKVYQLSGKIERFDKNAFKFQ